MTASIGPWSFSSMSGRLNVAAPRTAPLRRGLRIGRPVAQPAAITTIETAANWATAWAKAIGYRYAIGSFGRVVDDTNTVCELALVADALVTIEAKSTGATLRVDWTLIPAIWWGALGSANVNVTGSSNGILPTSGPTPDSTAPDAGFTVLAAGFDITYDSIVSTIQPPISEAQREAVRRASADMGVEMVPADQIGSARCDIAVTGEEAARYVMRRARYQVGTFGVFSVGGAVKLSPIAIADAVVTWRNSTGLGSTSDTLVTVNYDVRLDDNSGTDDPIASTTIAIVQVATVWGQWTTVEGAYCEGASEGLSATVGTTSFTIDAKLVVNNRTIVRDLDDHTGKWVRILVRVNDKTFGSSGFNGLSTSDTTEKVEPIWYGVCKGSSITGGAGSPGAQAVYTCAQIHDVLDQVFLTRWYEAGQGGEVANPGEVLPFNWDHAADRHESGLTGEWMASTGSAASDGADQQYPHRRHASLSNTPYTATVDRQPQSWTLRQITETILGAVMAQYPSGPRWQLDAQLTALVQELPSFDPRGGSALSMLAELLSPRHGLVFRTVVTSAELVQLRVYTTVATDTALGPGSIPANSLAAALNLASDGGSATTVKPFGSAGIGQASKGERFPGFRLSRDRSRQIDGLYVEGGRPWFMASFILRVAGSTPTPTGTSHWAFDWTSAQQTSWGTATTKQRADSALAHVWRRYRIRPDWDGRTLNNSSRRIMRMGRALTAGTQNETGEFVTDNNEPRPDPRTIKLTRCVPMPEGVDLSASGTYGSSEGKMNIPRGVAAGRPMIFGGITSSGLYENLGDRLSVTVDSDAGTIELGHSAEDAEFIYNYLVVSQNTIIVTIGVLGALPWRCSWRRPEASRPRNMERVLILRHPEMQYRHILEGTMVGVDASGNAKTAPQDGIADKDLDDANPGFGDRLNFQLKLARLWYEDLHRSLSWTQTATVTHGDSQPPGQMITTLTYPLDDKRKIDETINCPITARSWDFRKASISTSWECDRLGIGFDYQMIRRQNAGNVPAEFHGGRYRVGFG